MGALSMLPRSPNSKKVQKDIGLCHKTHRRAFIKNICTVRTSTLALQILILFWVVLLRFLE